MKKYKVAFQCPVLIIEASSSQKALELYNEELAGWYSAGMEPVIVEEWEHLGGPDVSEGYDEQED